MITSLPTAELTDAQKQTLAFMWNEEKMAKDLYLQLHAITPDQTLENIATKAEAQHQQSIQALLQKYNSKI